MAKKAGSRKKSAPRGKRGAGGRKRAAIRARLRKPTRAECVDSSIFKGHTAAELDAIFSPLSCTDAIKRKWSAYLKRKANKA